MKWYSQCLTSDMAANTTTSFGAASILVLDCIGCEEKQKDEAAIACVGLGACGKPKLELKSTVLHVQQIRH